MNPLDNYISAQRLAKHWMIVADKRISEVTDPEAQSALDAMHKALREFQTMTNIVAKLRFPKRK